MNHRRALLRSREQHALERNPLARRLVERRKHLTHPTAREQVLQAIASGDKAVDRFDTDDFSS